MDKKKVIIISSIILLLIGAQMMLVPLLKRLPFFTDRMPMAVPVNTLTGPIESKGWNSLTIVQYNKVYRFKITDKTIITGLIPALPQALLSLTPPQPKKLTLNDLKDGQFISVNTVTDLRDNRITEFEATSIQLPQVITTLNGTLVDIKGSDLLLKAMALRNPEDLKDSKKAASLPLEKTYTVKTNKNTGFFLELKKISLSDLKKNTRITVYSPVEMTGKGDITAQYVEVLPEPPPPAAEGQPTEFPLLSPPLQKNIAP